MPPAPRSSRRSSLQGSEPRRIQSSSAPPRAAPTPPGFSQRRGGTAPCLRRASFRGSPRTFRGDPRSLGRRRRVQRFARLRPGPEPSRQGGSHPPRSEPRWATRTADTAPSAAGGSAPRCRSRTAAACAMGASRSCGPGAGCLPRDRSDHPAKAGFAGENSCSARGSVSRRLAGT
ncbi:hypothetical protein T484DRAFT_1973974 [Baffinella frigidus]|nr:hypothetical protein T484DRAFT_1973974 [Cryptophyta sp. CCMP2293]